MIGALRDQGPLGSIKEEDFLRVKESGSLNFPNTPDDSAQNRGYINVVLTSIGRTQKNAGDEMYRWGMEALQLSEAALKAKGDGGLPRLSREVAVKLIKSAKKGKFALLFQQMTEEARV